MEGIDQNGISYVLGMVIVCVLLIAMAFRKPASKDDDAEGADNSAAGSYSGTGSPAGNQNMKASVVAAITAAVKKYQSNNS